MLLLLALSGGVERLCDAYKRMHGETAMSYRNKAWRIAGAGAALMAATTGAANATSFIFNPETITETFTDGELGDDDVDVQGVQNRVTTLNTGDDSTWRYTYTKGGPGYDVRSSDLADIDNLFISGRGTTGAKFDVTLQFSDLEGNLIGQVYTFTDVPADAAGGAVVAADELDGAREGDNVLGNLQGLKIGDFRLNVRVTAGRFELTDMTFNWEADDIEPARRIPEPPALAIAALGLAGLSLSRKRRAKKVGARQHSC